MQICFMTLGHSSVVGKESLKFEKVEQNLRISMTKMSSM